MGYSPYMSVQLLAVLRLVQRQGRRGLGQGPAWGQKAASEKEVRPERDPAASTHCMAPASLSGSGAFTGRSWAQEL